MIWRAIATLVVFVSASGCATDEKRDLDPNVTYSVPAIGHQKGTDDALVTIVEASDFQCSFCRTAAETIGDLAEQYGDDVRVLFVSFPLARHSRALPAAVAAECAAEQDSFWLYHNELFANQGELEDRSLRSYAGRVGLTMFDWLKCVEQPEVQQRVIDRQQRLVDIGIAVTPSFFINGRHIRGAQEREVFEDLIDDRLAEARRVIKEGVARQDYYQREIVEKGQP